MKVKNLMLLEPWFALPLLLSQGTDVSNSPPAEPEGPDPELLALFDYDEEAPLLIEENSVEEGPDYRRLDFTYESPAGGRVPAYLYMPHGDGPYAGILHMHGLPGSRDDMADLAVRYTRTGAFVLAISAPWARSDEMKPVEFTDEDRARQIQLIQDLRRAVDVLAMFPQVDAERIGYIGGSYGGAMGGLLAGVDHRVRAFVLMIGDGGLVEHFRPQGKPPRLSDEQWNEWRAGMEPIEPLQFVRFAAPSELLFQNGRVDRMVPAEIAERYHAAASEPKTVKWYEGGHGVSGEMIDDQVAWLAERLGLDADAF